MINLLIVDDHAMFRAGLRKVFSEEPDLHVVDEASDWHDGRAKLERHTVDVLLLDINLPDRSGLEALEVIGRHCPGLGVIMLSMYSEPQYALRAIRSGARGYVPKDMEIDQLLAAIRRVARGGMFVAPEIAASLLGSMEGGEATSAHERLSARESQVLRMMVAGESLTVIASHLAINIKTVSTYRRRILEKLGVTSNAQLVQYAVRHGLVD
jgi:two-component system, NarL family, invasion response regulator UvrY